MQANKTNEPFKRVKASKCNFLIVQIIARYYIRYLEPWNNDKVVSEEAEKYWLPVDLYVGTLYSFNQAPFNFGDYPSRIPKNSENNANTASLTK